MLIVPFRKPSGIEVRLVENCRPFGFNSPCPTTPLAHISRENYRRFGKEDTADQLIVDVFTKAVQAVRNGETFEAPTKLERLARMSANRALRAA